MIRQGKGNMKKMGSKENEREGRERKLQRGKAEEMKVRGRQRK